MARTRRKLSPSSSLLAYFGWRLRHWRQKGRLTQAELGHQVGYDHSHISKVETGERWPPRELAELCDETLGTGGELAALWPLLAEQPRESDAAEPAAAEPAATDRPSAVLTATPTIGVPAPIAEPLALVAGLPPSEPVAEPGEPDVVTDEKLHAFASLFTAYETAACTVEPAALIPPMEHQLRRLLRWRGTATRHQDAVLLELAARHAGLLGWLRFDSIAYADATAWFEWGCGWARAAANHELASELATMQAAVSCWERDAQTTIDRAQIAQVGTRLGPRVRAWAILAEARGSALTGADQDSTRLLGKARDLLDDTGPGGAPAWLSQAEAAKKLGIAEGTISLDLAVALDRPELGRRAIDQLTDTLRLDPTDRRHALLLQSRLADAYSCAGEPEAAADTIRAALGPAPSAGSPRLLHELHAAHHRLVTRWNMAPLFDRPVKRRRPPNERSERGHIAAT